MTCRIAALAIVGALLSGVAHADPIVTISATEFAANTSNISAITAFGAANGALVSSVTAPNGVTIGLSTPLTVGNLAAQSLPKFPDGYDGAILSGTGSITFTVPTADFAFDLDVAFSGTPPVEVDVFARTSDFSAEFSTLATSNTSPASAFDFLGFYGLTGQTVTLTITPFSAGTTATSFEIGNILVGQGTGVVGVPEPAGLAVVGAGLAGLAIAARRRRATVPAIRPAG